MKMKRYILSMLLLWTSTVFATAIKYADDIKVTASVSKSQVGTGEHFEVVYSISGNGNIEALTPPSFNGFQVLGGPNQSSSFTSVNGRTSSSMTLSYDLMAVKEGDYTIGGATLVISGKQYKTNAVKIKVVKGTAVPQNAQGNSGGRQPDQRVEGNASNIAKRLFIRAVANKTNVYQGEGLAVTYKLYTNIELVDNALDKLPDFNGFWSQEIKNNDPNVRWETETYQGSRYNVAVLKEIILFPERSGKLTLDPLAMTFLVRQQVSSGDSNDPFDMFFGSYKDVKYKIKSSPVTINVKPLPETGKPEGFEGAVGNFSIAAIVDKQELKANEALNYTLKITGSGNLKLLKAPTVNFPADLEKYDPKLTDRLTESLNGVSGTREYAYLLIPRHEGNYTIEPLKFSYFNPSTQKYVTLSTGSFDLKVAKGAPGSNVTAYSSANQQDIKMLAKDITYIKTDMGGLHQKGSSFYGSTAYYLLLCCGPLLFAGALVYRKRYRENNRDQVAVRGRNANKIAAKHLASAKKQLLAGQTTLFYQDVYKGLYQYLGDKFNIAAAELNKDNIRTQLFARGIDERLIKQLEETLDLCEMARYAPVSGISEQEVFDKAKNTINEIETNA
ncbi:hypothetical protein Phep_1484 [Pedobacter heparinus DSM 2366]|uniref:BatD protein n=2 Tax=Sphingobacteriaceae TaxID=84566 RepID=C6XTR2_PEDHD|nr:hypothetical protein Phep_1484 [Pedobacter heparinus DSM 2366]